MIVTGISAVVGLGIMEMLFQQGRSTKQIENMADMTILRGQLQADMGQNCATILGLPGSLPAVLPAVQTTYNLPALGGADAAIQPNTWFGGIYVNLVQLTYVPPIASSPNTPTLYLQIQTGTAPITMLQSQMIGAASAIQPVFKINPGPTGAYLGLRTYGGIVGGKVTTCGNAPASISNVPYQYTDTLPTLPGNPIGGAYTIIGFGGAANTPGNFEMAFGSGTILAGDFQSIPLPPGGGWSYTQFVANVSVQSFWSDNTMGAIPAALSMNEPSASVASSDYFPFGAVIGITNATGYVSGGSGGDGHPHYQTLDTGTSTGATVRAMWTAYAWRTIP